MIRSLGMAVIAAGAMCAPTIGAGPTVPFMVIAVPAEDADELLLAGKTGNTSLAVDFANGSTKIDLPTGPPSDQPQAIILEWRDGTRAEFPVFIFPEFAGYEIQLRFLHVRNLPSNQSEADKLCRDSRPSDTGFAFEMVFGCRSWAEQLETRSRKWSKEYNWAINGWVIGNRFLFRRTVDANNDQLSPFGYQEPLIARLREAVERVSNGLNSARLEPLDLEEVRDVLLEHDQTLLRYVGQTGPLIELGRYTEALDLNRVAYDVFQQTVAKGDQPSVYGIDEGVLIKHMLDLRERLAVP